MARILQFNTPESEAEYIELIENMTKTFEALLENPEDEEAWEDARTFVKCMREENLFSGS